MVVAGNITEEKKHMCEFFSFVTEPNYHGGQRFFFNWEYRKRHIDDKNDRHSLICKHFELNEDECNKYEFNPITQKFIVDGLHSLIDDRVQAEEWVNKLDFKKIVKPLIVKPIVNPFSLPAVEKVTPEIISLLKQWASAHTSAEFSTWKTIQSSVGVPTANSIQASIESIFWEPIWYPIWLTINTPAWNAVVASMHNFMWAYIASFFDIEYQYDFSSAVILCNMGIVPIFDGKTWSLCTGKDAHVIYKVTN